MAKNFLGLAPKITAHESHWVYWCHDPVSWFHKYSPPVNILDDPVPMAEWMWLDIAKILARAEQYMENDRPTYGQRAILEPLCEKLRAYLK